MYVFSSIWHDWPFRLSCRGNAGRGITDTSVINKCRGGGIATFSQEIRSRLFMVINKNGVIFHNYRLCLR